MDDNSANPIPLIDLAPLADGGPEGAAEIAPVLRAALEDIGFLIIVNHGVPQDLIDQTFAQAKRFHDQDMEAKRAVLMNAHNNGYMAMARYGVRTSRVSEDVMGDMNESFFIKRERSADDVLAGRRFGGPNEWPAGLPGFREHLLEYTETVDALGRRLLPAVALALDMPANTFDAAFEESQFSFRLSHYPPIARTPGQYGFAPHTDANFMTFLAQSGVPGLQMLTGDGDWLELPAIPGTFAVNLGDLMQQWTNDKFVSTAHRVINTTAEARYSLVQFFGVDYDVLVEGLPGCVSAAKPWKYKAIKAGDHSEQMVARTYGYDKENN